VRLLGAGAGGGLPQWNCNCVNCIDARLGRIPRRSQSSVAVGDGHASWFLINASPDLRNQMDIFADLQPKAGTLRGTTISGTFLTNADLDHVLGIFSLREGNHLHVYAPGAVHATLDACLNLTPVMNAFCGISWHESPVSRWMPMLSVDGLPTNLSCRAIPLPGKKPLFDPQGPTDGIHSVAYEILDRDTGGRLLVAPDVGRLTDELIRALEEAGAVLFDGTFWSEEELSRIRPGSRSAAEMGHVPIKTSLPVLHSLNAAHKIYIHINNTNPVLSRQSLERTLVEDAGILIGYDGLELAI
jgi:pyrroloquinoline quinone biosynthesis protein B